MSLKDKNQKCAVCSAYLFEEDDIVYCPICGAPHHRDCYSSIGKCGFEATHGTDQQYRREEVEEKKPLESNKPDPTHSPALRCRGCGAELDENSHFCNNCGTPMGMNAPTFVFQQQIHQPPVKEDTLIADSVSAKDAAKVVKNNAFRYIPRFLKLNPQNKRSWNWAAFLLPHGWFAYRKMYKESIITAVLTITSIVMNFPLSLAVAGLPLPNGEGMRNTLELAEYYAQFADKIGFLPILLSFLGLVLGLVIRIVSGLYGDYIYKERVVLSVGLIKSAEDRDAAETKYSGVSFIGFFIAVFAVEFIPTFLSMFLM